MVSLDHVHYTRNLAFSKSFKTVLLEGMHKIKHQTKLHAQSALCPKMLCNILIRMLNSNIHKLLSEKTALAN